jgi:hypothetical protein
VVGLPWAADSCPWGEAANRVTYNYRYQRAVRCSWCRLINVRVPEVVNVCVPVMVNHGVLVGARVRVLQQESGSIYRSCMLVHRLSLLSVQWVPARPLFGCGLCGLVGFEAVRL